MRRTILPAGMLLCVMALASDSPKEYDDKTEYVGIEGTWRLTVVEYEGRKTNPYGKCVTTTTYRSGIYTDNFSNGDKTQGNFSIDSSLIPPHLDEIQPSGTAIKCIYQVDSDTLRLAFMAGISPMPRPKGFNDKDVIVYIYKRVK